MSTKKTTTIEFQVTVDCSTIPPIFTYYNEQHVATNGNVVAYMGEVTEIVYTLATPNLFFIPPAMTNNIHADFNSSISNQGQTLTITDDGNYDDRIGLQLIVENQTTGQRYASPDPSVRNRPR